MEFLLSLPVHKDQLTQGPHLEAQGMLSAVVWVSDSLNTLSSSRAMTLLLHLPSTVILHCVLLSFWPVWGSLPGKGVRHLVPEA